MAEAAGEAAGVPGVVSSIQTFGSFARWNPHLHLVVAEGLFTAAGAFQAVDWFDAARLEEEFRRRVLLALHDEERLSPEGRERLLAWEHSGFSVFFVTWPSMAGRTCTSSVGRRRTWTPFRSGRRTRSSEDAIGSGPEAAGEGRGGARGGPGVDAPRPRDMKWTARRKRARRV